MRWLRRRTQTELPTPDFWEAVGEVYLYFQIRNIESQLPNAYPERIRDALEKLAFWRFVARQEGWFGE